MRSNDLSPLTSGGVPRSSRLLITGAARGLGRALTTEFAGRGWQVIATDIDREALRSLDKESGICTGLMDVASDDSVHHFVKEVRERFGTLDLIINNAGIDRYFPFSEAPSGLFREIFEVNLFGACRVNQAFLPLLRAPGGRILLIGSESYHLTLPFMPYPLTKRALESYARALRQELWFRGIDVVVIRPGPIRTRFISDLSEIRYPRQVDAAASTEETCGIEDKRLSSAFQRFVRQVPDEVGRVMPPEEAARRICRIAGIKRPRHLYRINNSLRLRMARLLPFPILEKAIRLKLS